MKWNLKNISKETNHPFLNYYTLTYEVEKADGHHVYSYFMASRKESDKLRSLTKDFSSPDGVIIPTICFDNNNKKYFIFTKQFRPAINSYIYSVPAGLVDNNEDIELTAKREVEEEAGAIVYETEVLSSAAPTSSGLSDEFNAVVLAKVKSFSKQNLEEFEEINTIIVPFEEADEFINNHFFALQPKFIIKYLLEKYR